MVLVDIITPITVIVAFILLKFIYSWMFSNFYIKGLPPLSDLTIFEIFRNAHNGSLLAEYFKASRKLGSIFCVKTANNFFMPTIICGDIELLKIVLLGDNTNKHPAMEKSFMYKRYNFISLQIPSILTKKTENEGWHWARKGVSPSFSNTNLYQTIPLLNKELNRLVELMCKMSSEGKRFDVVSLSVHFTIDFLTLSMFGESFNTLAEFEKPLHEATQSDGKTFLDAMTGRVMVQVDISSKLFCNHSNSHMCVVISKEFVLRSVDPLRKFKFWDTGVKRVKAAQLFQMQFSKSLLEKYRSNHSEYIENDQSIMKHLLQRFVTLILRVR